MKIILVLMLALSTASCFSKEKKESKPGHGKISFETKKITIGGIPVTVEVADNKDKILRGLMFRHEKLKENHGMIFLFKGERVRSFWMKNTFIPLSIGFFNSKKELVSFFDMKPVSSEMEVPESYSSKKPAMIAVELAPGWFERNKVKLGAKLSLK